MKLSLGEYEVEVEIPDDIQEQVTSIRQRLENLQALLPSPSRALNELIIDATALETTVSKPFDTTVEIEPPERDED